MTVLEAIASRRSIRRFKETPFPRAAIERILAAACLAPSGKNRQPWRFVVLESGSRDKAIQLMREGIERLRACGAEIGSAEWTAGIMAKAPVTILIFNAESLPETDHSGLRRYPWLTDIQSIGGAIQTMLLAALEEGLGTLWICEIFGADCAVREWLGRRDELVAAVALGYPDEAPVARPQREWAEITDWMG